jgi:hypothetical protein
MTKETPYDAFDRSQKNTRIVRKRKNLLYTFGNTKLPYVFLADSTVNEGDIVVRKGEITVNPLKIITMNELPAFEGFQMEGVEDQDMPLILNRCVRFPPATYKNSNSSLDVVPGPLDGVVEDNVNKLDQKNDIRTGVICGLDDLWAFALLEYVGQMVVNSAESNINEYMERRGLS